MDCSGKACPQIHSPEGECIGKPKFREPTLAELNSTNPKTPHRHVGRVRITCPTGRVLDSVPRFENGEEMRNVLRAVISLEPPDRDGRGGIAQVYLMRFNNEIGKVVYEVADCLIGDDPA